MINELRKGNLVKGPMDELMQVDIIGHTDNPNYIHAKNTGQSGQNGFAPLPITTDLLVKCGWIDTGRYCSYGISRDCYFWYGKESGIVGITITGENDAETPLPHITHIHHIQNLIMALSGKEWDIKL